MPESKYYYTLIICENQYNQHPEVYPDFSGLAEYVMQVKNSLPYYKEFEE